MARQLLALAACAAALRLPATPRSGRAPRAHTVCRATATRLPQLEDANDEGLGYAASVAAGSAKRAERMESLGTSDMAVTFLGTASCVPSTTRGVSCAALRYEGSTWLFDAGEGSQVQAQRSANTHPGKIDAIFVTHLHGDHVFGLPGLLCLAGQNRESGDDRVIEIFGPEGLRTYLRASLALTHSRITAPYVVHELAGVPLVPPPGFRPPRARPPLSTSAGPDSAFGESGPGRDIPRDADGAWTCAPRGALAVRAAPMKHTVPCVGYCVVEPDRPGALDVAAVAPVLDRNFAALKKAGVKEPKKIYRLLKEMKPGQTFTFPDGTKVAREDVVADDKPGRVLVFAGDTADASALLPLLPPRGADLVVHEATNAKLSPWDNDKSATQVDRATAAHGHSTPAMAAAFAIAAGADRLALTHFSPRYKGDAALSSLATMAKIEKAALAGDRPFRGAYAGDSVIAAWDLLCVPVFAKTARRAAKAAATKRAAMPVATKPPARKRRARPPGS